MGIWGINIYDNDIALDVKYCYIEMLNNGKTSEEILKQMTNDFSDSIEDRDDAPFFWCALADTQWEYGRLQEEVKKRALEYLENGSLMARWESLSPKELNQLKKILNQLKEKLTSPQPLEKKIKRHRCYHCEWQCGDVYSYQLESELAEKMGLLGRHFLIQKVDETVCYPEYTIPIVTVKITMGSEIPLSLDDQNRLEYVQMHSRKFDPIFEEFRPKGENLTIKEFLEAIEDRKKSLSFDEYGFLPVFRVVLVNTSKKVISPKLKFVGNFELWKAPSLEFVPHDSIELPTIGWSKQDIPFEISLLQSYSNFNLRQSPIYSDRKK